MKHTHTFAALFFAILITSCQPQTGSTRQGGTLRMNISDIPHVVFPGEVSKRSEQIIASQVYTGLVKYNPRTLEIVPSIASRFTISDDGLVYTFTLNSRARFQNDRCFVRGKGRTIVAADFKYSIEQICRNKITNGYEVSRQIANIVGFDEFLPSAVDCDTIGISGIEVPNDSIVIIRLKKPDKLFIHYLAGTNAMVFAPEAYNAYGVNGTVGSGAFMMSYPKIKGQPITLIANSGYWMQSRQGERLPLLDTLIFSFITSTQKELYIFSKGMTNVVFDIPANCITDFLDQNIEEFQSDPPRFLMTNTVSDRNDKRFNLLTSDVNGLYINAMYVFDFSEVYLKSAEPNSIVVNAR